MQKDELRHKVAGMRNSKRGVEEKTKASSAEMESAMEEYQLVKLQMDKLFAKFREVGFETTVSRQEMPYDEGTVLTENNITGYLQEIEELISYMITYQAVRMGEANASLASVAVKNLPEKSFDRRNIAVKLEPTTNEGYEREYALTMKT